MGACLGGEDHCKVAGGRISFWETGFWNFRFAELERPNFRGKEGVRIEAIKMFNEVVIISLEVKD